LTIKETLYTTEYNLYYDVTGQAVKC